MKYLILLIIGNITFAQQKEAYPATVQELADKIIILDAEAFAAYNACNLESFRNYFTEDLEFYHDKGGFSKGVDKLMEGMVNNICNNAESKVIRKPLLDSFQVYPLEGYGAILSGNHDFYRLENGIERKTGTAKFTSVWLLTNGRWQMSRVLSYDHKSVP
jgi:hypothetical protein